MRRRYNTSTTPSTTPQRPNPSILATSLGFIRERNPGKTEASQSQRRSEPYREQAVTLPPREKNRSHGAVYPTCMRAGGQGAFRHSLELVFGDAKLRNPLLVDGPDITLFSTPKDEYGRREVVAVGNVVEFWTLNLEDYPVCRRASDFCFAHLSGLLVSHPTHSTPNILWY